MTLDTWDHYWERSRNRDNGNIRTPRTQSHKLFANYGVSSKLNVIAHVPQVKTEATQGVLAGMRGWQDATPAVKYKLFEAPVEKVGSFRAIALVSGAAPMCNYTPNFLPLSIGLASRRLSARLTGHFRTKRGWCSSTFRPPTPDATACNSIVRFSTPTAVSLFRIASKCPASSITRPAPGSSAEKWFCHDIEVGKLHGQRIGAYTVRNASLDGADQ